MRAKLLATNFIYRLTQRARPRTRKTADCSVFTNLLKFGFFSSRTRHNANSSHFFADFYNDTAHARARTRTLERIRPCPRTHTQIRKRLDANDDNNLNYPLVACRKCLLVYKPIIQ